MLSLKALPCEFCDPGEASRVASPLPLPCFTGDVQLPYERVDFSIVEVVINEQEVEASGSKRPVSVGQAWCDGNGML